MLKFEVEDTGVGIALEDQARIFEPFVQVGGPATKNGTGLGLTITQQFVTLMGGSILVKANPGEGSRFRVELPAETAPPSELPAQTVDREQVVRLEEGQPDYRILIAEDRPENWMLLERLLENAGFAVRVARNGAQAIEEFQAWHPHFIWMDLRMPVMDGLEAARRIRALEGGLDVKIVAITASGLGDRREAMAAGMDDFLRKPYQHDEVFECMARFLGIRYISDAVATGPAAELSAALRLERLAALPENLRREMALAVVRLDIDGIWEAIDRVSACEPELGSALAMQADRLAFTEMYKAIESRGSAP
jgi:CheY-like chemotaxis protein